MNGPIENLVYKSDTIKDFLDEYTANETIRQHRIALKKYFTYHNKIPDTYIKDIRNLNNRNKNKIMDQYEHDITKYRNYLIEQKYSPKSIHNYISSVKMLLEHHRIDIGNAFWKKLKKRGEEKYNESICDFQIPTREELKKILMHANTKPRALFLLQSSSGMRIGEICNLTENDIDLTFEYPHIQLRKTKSRAKGRTRCSPEAKEAIQEWLKIRPDNGDPRLFQCKTKTARIMWNRLLKKAGYIKTDRSGKYPRFLMGTHTLRKYFRNEFSKYSNDLAAYLMNQRTGLDRKYREWTDKYLDEEYSKGVENVLVFQQNVTSERVGDLEQQLHQVQKDKQEMQDKIADLESKLSELKIEKLEQDGTDIKTLIKEILKERNGKK